MEKITNIYCNFVFGNFREASVSNAQRTPRKTPRYMMPTEAVRRKSVPSRSESAEPREKYPDWYENQENESEPGRLEKSPYNSSGYNYNRKSSPRKDYYRTTSRPQSTERNPRSPSGKNYGRNYDRKSSPNDHYYRRTYPTQSPEKSNKYDYNDRNSTPNN